MATNACLKLFVGERCVRAKHTHKLSLASATACSWLWLYVIRSLLPFSAIKWHKIVEYKLLILGSSIPIFYSFFMIKYKQILHAYTHTFACIHICKYKLQSHLHLANTFSRFNSVWPAFGLLFFSTFPKEPHAVRDSDLHSSIPGYPHQWWLM